MKQSQQEVESAGGEVTATAPTPKPVIPKVRYHPTIHTRQAGDSQTRTTRSAAGRPPTHADNARQQNHQRSTSRVNPEPAGTRPQQNTAPEPDQQELKAVKKKSPKVKNPQTPEPRADLTPQIEHGGLPRGPPRLEDVPLGLGGVLETHVVEKVEVKTRGQATNPEWFDWRKNRITASVAHRIAHCRFLSGTSKTPPTSYLTAITGEGPNVQTRAMRWGVEMEAEAVRQYQVLKSRLLGRAVRVQECGLFIDARRPWLAASPDGIVLDGESGRRLLCLEVKCPYKHRERSVEEACRVDPSFCLEIEEGRERGQSPVYRLKPSHSYYTQIQCQQAVSGLHEADLVVFTPKETAIVPVTFDPDLWEETVSRLEVFYRDCFLPYLRDKRGQDGGAGWTPEQ